MVTESNFSRREFVSTSFKGVIGIGGLSRFPDWILAERDGINQSRHDGASVPEKWITFIDNNKSDWQIFSLDKSDETRFASAELQKYLLQISGVTLPVNKDIADSRNIIIGKRSELHEKYRTLLPPAVEGYDGYTLVVSEPGTIIIAGDNGQGTIYGVYDFLERLGCRWFYPTQDSDDPEVIPKLSTVSVPFTTFTMTSPVQYRICNGDAWYWDMDYTNAIKQIDWGMKNRYNMMGWQGATSSGRRSLLQQYRDFEDAGVINELKKRGMTIHGPAHSFDQFLRSDEYFDQHPEWFGLHNGKRVTYSALVQFCWSNVEARKQFVSNAEAFIMKAPFIRIFMTIPFDGGVACECENCKKAGPSNLLMTMIGELIDRLSVSCPAVKVETIGGYGPVEEPPSELGVIHPKMRIGWAQWGRYHGIGYDDPKYNSENLKKWREAAKGGFTIVQYYTDNFAEPWVMGPFTTAMVSDRRFFLKNQVDGIYMLMYPPGYWWNHALNGYIAGRIFYDVSLDPLDQVKEYATHYFGKDAGPLLAEYYTEWANHIDLSYHIKDGGDQKERDILADERKKWIDPAVNAVKNDKLYSYRVNKVALLHTVAEELADVQVLRSRIRFLRRQEKWKEASVVLNEARVQADKTMLLLYSTAGLKKGLIDINEVPGFIKIGVQGWIDEEAKRVASRRRD